MAFCHLFGTLNSWAECWQLSYHTQVLLMHLIVCVPCLMGMHRQSEKRVKGSILVNLCRWAEVQLLVNNKSLLFCASDAHTKAAKVIKYVTQYGTEVHQTLSNARLAPMLYQLVQLPGAFMQVSLLLSHSLACFVDSNKSCHCPAAV